MDTNNDSRPNTIIIQPLIFLHVCLVIVHARRAKNRAKITL